jgi:cysteine-rich repeat protein
MKTMAKTAVVLMMVAGCSTGTGDAQLPDRAAELEVRADAQRQDVASPDFEVSLAVPPEVFDSMEDYELPPACKPGEGCFGDSCTDNKQCLSGFCVGHLGGSVCTMECVEECPAGFECRQVTLAGMDVVFVCLSKHANLCLPCKETKDCAGFADSGEFCIKYPDQGWFCGGACAADPDCPDGFACTKATTVAGDEVLQCTPLDGECECSDKAVAGELATNCAIANEFGSCAGTRMCTDEGLSPCDAPLPAADECNSVDDDCDGEFDELGCDDGNECTVDSCQGKEGCSNEPETGTPCDDGNACTESDSCAAGVCVGPAVNCDDEDVCTDDSCDPATGCLHLLNNAPCDDGEPCTVGDVCINGACSATPMPCNCEVDSDCAFLDDADACNGTLFCNQAEVPFKCAVTPGSIVTCPAVEGLAKYCLQAWCDPATGSCAQIPHNDGGICDDADACTLAEACSGGVCAGGVAANCNDGNQCTADSCDPLAGCLHDQITGFCSDGDGCTGPDICQDGVCTSGPQLSCDDGNVCTADSCDQQVGCLHVPAPGACDDGNACTTGDLCKAGLCAFSGTPDCDDGNVCTNDLCDPGSGCQNPPNTALCTDGNACTSGDVCLDGGCLPGEEIDCNDGNVCSDDLCLPNAGCLHSPNLAACDDMDPCTVTDTCVGSKCVGTQAPDCDDKNPCTNDLCVPKQGCFHQPNADPCDDGSICTAGDLCKGGNCVAGAPIVCDDDNLCTDDVCAAATGCKFTPNTAACDDGNACTLGEACLGGKCQGAGVLSCDDSNPCTADSCIPSEGCHHAPVPGACNDSDACTKGDHCDAGLCAGAPVSCEDGNVCTDDACDPQQGCGHTPNQAACDDGNACTTGDHCAAGKCSGEGALQCDDANPCTKDSCAPGGGCSHLPLEGPCNDLEACTTGDTCQAGKCVGLAPLDCDDGNTCTKDSCGANGCIHEPLTQTACDDSNQCTTTDLCAAGICVGSGVKSCDDGKICTTEYCDPAIGCVTQVNASPCDDGNLCTTADTCFLGACKGGPALVCTDGNACTDDSCLPGAGCQFTPTAGACNDGNACTSGDKCVNGMCVGAGAVNCDDGNVCTNDACDVGAGCTHANNTSPCSDSNACTTSDTCSGGGCVPGPALSCNDGNVCTSDSCNAATGCVFSPNAVACDDGNPCTTGDVCANSLCKGPGVKDCSDSNSCTNDSCSAASGCVNNKIYPCCGNGLKEGSEQCDDNNQVNGDGCSSTCQTEGANCPSPSVAEGSYCWLPGLNCSESHGAACARVGKTATAQTISCGWSQSMANNIASKLGKSIYKGCCASTMFCGGSTCRVDAYTDPFWNWNGCVDGLPPLYSCNK